MIDEYRNYIEWIGYIGSLLVVISLMMSSIVKLRWYNLIGAIVFATYGFLIGALPIGLVNIIIAGVNIFQLNRIYNQNEFFKILHIRKENKYLDFFMDYHYQEINAFFPGFYDSFKNDQFNEKEALFFLILRNCAVAGIFMGTRTKDDELAIQIDFVIPEYRDLKPGKYIYYQNINYFRIMGIKKLITNPKSEKHYNYLKKMGFEESITEDKSIILAKNTSNA
jgi:hypothetical protein